MTFRFTFVLISIPPNFMKKFAASCLLLSTLLALLFLFPSCEKDPEIITKTIIKTDTITITSIDTVFLTLTDTVSLTTFIQDTATTFILLRQAETTGTGADPVLSTAGQARAETLRRIMGKITLGSIYSTDYNRTKQTAQPTATEKMLVTNIYNPSALGAFADEVLTNHHGETVLVLGHSNTTPSMLNVLAGTNIYANLPDTEYDNLFIVTVFEKGRVKVLHLKYGE